MESIVRHTISTVSLVAFCLFVSGSFADTATYRLTVDNTWSELTHPGGFPNDAHFSWIGGGSHTDAVSFWDVGVVGTPGIKQMAETGSTSILMSEVQNAIDVGTAGTQLNWQHWFCPAGTTHPSCGPLVVEFEIDDAYPLVTLVSMLGPTPDWFIGVSGLALHDGAEWIDVVQVELFPYDGGTRDANQWQLFGPLTSPPEPVSLITTASGQLIGPDSLGTFTFERVVDSFVRGDANADGTFDVADAVFVLAALFAGGDPATCDDAADVNDDGALDISDPVTALGALFAGGVNPRSPFPDCGVDPTADSLDCEAFAACP